jgi:hypothetical protein
MTGAMPANFCSAAASGNRSRRRQQARSESRASARQGSEELVVRQLRGEAGYLFVEAYNACRQRSELGQQRVDQHARRHSDRIVRVQGLELVAMAKEQLEHDLGVGRIVLGTARREGAAIASDGGGLHREQDEEVVLEQR